MFGMLNDDGSLTFYTGGRRILQTVLGDLNGGRAVRGTGDRTDFWSTLSEV